MTLKNRISLLVSLVFTVLYGIASVFVFYLASDFRTQEFNDRLEIKALKTIKFLSDYKNPNYRLLRLIDKNSINKLGNEKTLIFDSDFNLLYSSTEDSKIDWYLNDLKFLKKNKSFFRKNNNDEYYGTFIDTNQKDYYVLITAHDSYGQSKTLFLKYVLIVTYIVFSIICWFLTSFMVKKALNPLTLFHKNIKKINESNLDTRIVTHKNTNEVDLLANEFNFMMDRIELSYKRQKEFTAQASHELRTPLSRITSQIENKINSAWIDEATKNMLSVILLDINHLTELIHSLLLLSKSETIKVNPKERVRLDELLFDTIEIINKTYPNFTILFDIEDHENLENALEISANKNLLSIAFLNVLKNACLYSDNKQADVLISCDEAYLYITVSNNGQTLSIAEQQRLFQAFMRGTNALKINGFGLGLRIVQRILNIHLATIKYFITKDNSNCFQLKFPF